MKEQDILNVIIEFSYSQGFYGRLLRDIMEFKENDPDGCAEWMASLEERNFSEPLDVIYYFEC